MAPSKLADRAPPTVVPNGAPPLRASRLPAHLRLPILLVLNLGLQSVLWTFTNNLLGNELGAVSKKPGENDLVTPAARLGYKMLVIWLGWRLKYDCTTAAGASQSCVLLTQAVQSSISGLSLPSRTRLSPTSS